MKKNMLWQSYKKVQNQKNPIQVLDTQQFSQDYSQ